MALTIENSHIVQTAEVQSMKESCDFITKILSGMCDKNQENFVKLLIENARLKFATDIFNQYQYIADQKQRRFKAEVVSASTLDKDIEVENGGNKAAAKVVGESVAKKALEKGISEVAFDRGGFLFHGRVKELADGAREAGLKF